MSRAGYNDSCDGWELIMYRGAVTSATRGKRGQRLFRDLKDALEAMPLKRLITYDLECDGDVCALGALGRARGVDMSELDPCEWDHLADTFDVAPSLAREVMFENDEVRGRDTPEERWHRMHAWVCSQITTEKTDSEESSQ